ncbi:hypothetical protein M404DRAFT_31009 [Pisolithus tinctorius Marx 270]|uniref:Chromo domain-containing protein n=1 Tax=Pisolithus tinctorius Marx 270 TaxID=870435 RepID=A0A0C3JMX7_PISTI|nr:hypothetical protein M404DRAFT_31009 [Pisolithus tinctorius Marx 270]
MAVLIVVDWLSKQAIFIPTYDTVTAPELTRLFLLHVFSKHGVLAHDNWADILPLAEFAYNNAPSTTTSVSPFFTNKGYHPNILVYPEHDLTSAQACDYAHYQGLANAKCIPAPDFKVCDQVCVKVRYFWSTWPSKKLLEKNLSPYPVIAQASTHSFTLCLPDSMCTVHPVFHVSQLKLTIPNTILNQMQPPPPPVKVDGKLEFEVADILNSKVNQHHLCWLQYLVWWTSYKGTKEETTWVLATELDNASKLVQEFHSHYPSKPSPFQ